MTRKATPRVAAPARTEIATGSHSTSASEAQIHQLIGRIQGASLVQNMASMAVIRLYLAAKARIAETGLIALTMPDGTSSAISSIEEFCEASMGLSARRCRQLVSEMKAVGDDLYEQSERLGFRGQDYQAIRSLPPDDQAAVKQALASANPEDAREVLHELVQRNQMLRAKNDELAATLSARQKILHEKSALIEEMREREEMHKNPSIAQAEAEQIKKLGELSLHAKFALAGVVSFVDTVFSNPASAAAELDARHTLNFLVASLADECKARGIHVDVDKPALPAWAKQIEQVVALGDTQS